MLDVAIVGGGPVGTYLGCLLAQAGLQFAVFEKRIQPMQHSRAIGIHPRALHSFEVLGLTEQMRAAGVSIRRGLLLGEQSRVLGELGFEAADAQHPYILSLPQMQTEQLLRQRLEQLAPGALQSPVTVTGFEQERQHVRLTLQCGSQQETLSARYVVAADGWQSKLRQMSGVPFRGGVYSDRYLMGDFPDTTPFGADAMITLCAEGVVESFPLPEQKRRWVVHTGEQLLDDPRPADLTTRIHRRTRLPVPADECQMLSAFEVRRHLADRMVQGRLCLIGDAGHVVSPIGGQGMNLGWLDAAALAPLLIQAAAGNPPTVQEWQTFEQTRRRSAWIAARQAEANMSAGRPTNAVTQRAREVLLTGLLQSPSSSAMLARAFTMRWL